MGSRCVPRERREVRPSLHAVPKSSEILAALAQVFESYSDEEKKAQIKKASSLCTLSSPGPNPYGASSPS